MLIIRVAAIAAVVLALGAAPVAAATEQPAATESAPGGSTIHQVTLPTGDRLVLRTDGVNDDVRVDAPATGLLHRYRSHGARYAVPARAVPLLKAGKLNQEDFNVDRMLGRPSPAGQPRADSPVHDLTVHILDRSGKPGGYAHVINLDTGEAGLFLASGQTAQVPAGRYAVTSAVLGDDSQVWDYTHSLYSQPELKLTANRTLTLDHRNATEVAVKLDNLHATEGLFTAGLQLLGDDWGTEQFVGRYPETRLFAGSVPGVKSAEFRQQLHFVFEQPDVELHAGPLTVRPFWAPGTPRPALSANLRTAYAGSGSAEDLAGVDVRGRLVVVAPQLDEADPAAQVSALVKQVAAAGGRFVVIHWRDNEPAASALAAGAASGDLALPTAITHRVNAADQLVDLAKTGAQTAVKTVAATPFRYTLGFVDSGSVGSTARTVSTTDLASVKASFHNATPTGITATAHLSDGATTVSPGLVAGEPAPVARTDFYTPGRWSLDVLMDQEGCEPGCFVWNELAQIVDLRQGTANPALIWNGAVIGPALRGSTTDGTGSRPWAWRDGDRIDVRLPLYTDGAGHLRLAASPISGSGRPGFTRLYCNGELVGDTPLPGIGQFQAGPGEATYQLAAEATADPSHWPTSTRVTAEWTFRSGNPGQPALPLFTARFTPAVDLANTTPAGQPQIIPITIDREDGVAAAPMTHLSVDVSTNDGNSWEPPAALQRGGEQWLVTVTNPPHGHVSLHLKATDAAGTSLDQTIIRAYAVR